MSAGDHRPRSENIERWCNARARRMDCVREPPDPIRTYRYTIVQWLAFVGAAHMRIRSIEEAVHLANDSAMVLINEVTTTAPALPLGGVKNSGYGRELSHPGIVERKSRCSSATDGEIAAINLESARRGAWARFERNARAPGVAEALVDMEGLTAQFFGDPDALDRLQALATQLARVDGTFRAAMVSTEAASAAHRFAEAREHLARAALMGAPRDEIERHSLTLDQACGVALDAVLAARRRIAEARGRLEDLVPLGAVLADLERFAEADAVYRQAFFSYTGGSPFPLAWVCFQLGMLWGELVPVPDENLAALWYRRAIAYVPRYVKARVHLAEICMNHDDLGDAEELLVPALLSGDPEVRWRLADALLAQGRYAEAEIGRAHV